VEFQNEMLKKIYEGLNRRSELHGFKDAKASQGDGGRLNTEALKAHCKAMPLRLPCWKQSIS
jgi:hypothetical protein